MQTVVKKAEDLKQGDILDDGAMVIHVDLVDFISMTLMTVRGASVNRMLVPRKDRFGVQAREAAPAPALTLAQQHADELAGLVLMASAILRDFPMTSGSDFKRHRASFAESPQPVLNKIRPPEPPTLEEALTALDSLHKNAQWPSKADEAFDKADAVLDRARHAGLLKGE